MCDLETRMQPDPEQERILARINSKLDAIERRKATLSAPYGTRTVVGTRAKMISYEED